MSCHSVFWALCFASLLAPWSGCDAFLACDGDTCNAQDGGMEDAWHAFELRATVPLDGATRFVGLYGDNSAIFLKKSASQLSFVQNILDLSKMEDKDRIVENKCSVCPATDKISFEADRIYSITGQFYKFIGLDGSIAKIENSKISAISDISFSSTGPRPFYHPGAGLLAFSSLETTSSQPREMVLSSSLYWKYNLTSNTATSFMVGYFSDQYGYVFVQFSGSTVVFAQPLIGSSQYYILQGALQDTINAADNGNVAAVNASFVGNLDSDHNQEFIFAKGVNIFASTYKSSGQDYNFINWKEPLVTITGEAIVSLVAKDLTNDGYPELIVETDKAVHFYLNNLKNQQLHTN